mmetsp:Transcript_4294/g.13559  ORF Transcript_4294/g.13559 Transcript_4294/m.13559 type:complete len:152 (-) Transcript_4294:681-1136(-)
MSADDARAGKIELVPPAERKRCAFWRVWCLVELAAALAESKPVVMLVGSRQPSGEFEPDPRMLVNMYRLVDINDSEATLPEDVALILDASRLPAAPADPRAGGPRPGGAGGQRARKGSPHRRAALHAPARDSARRARPHGAAARSLLRRAG